MVSDNVDHDGTFWGIGFPVAPPSPDISTIGVVEDDLERRGNAVLDPRGEGFDLAVVADAVVCKLDRKFIEHKMRF
jgi:hypothetical protein